VRVDTRDDRGLKEARSLDICSTMREFIEGGKIRALCSIKRTERNEKGRGEKKLYQTRKCSRIVPTIKDHGHLPNLMLLKPAWRAR
jgi:hypothetical protein